MAIEQAFYEEKKQLVLTGELRYILAIVFKWLVGELQIDSNRGLLFRGQVGNGKSSIMKACYMFCKTFYEVNCMYVNADKVSRLYEENSESSHFEINKLMSCRLLFIDDIGCEAVKVYNFHPMSEIIRERYDKKRITCATTNRTHKELRQIYGDSFEDKLSHMTYLIEFEETSKR